MAASSSLSPASFNDHNTQLQGSALKAIRASLALPADIPFHRSVHPDFAKELDQCSARILSITNQLLTLAGTTTSSTDARAKGKALLGCHDDVADRFHSLVVDVMDQLLERADIGLDEYLGHSKAPAIAINAATVTAQKPKKNTAQSGRLDPALQHASYLPKPQLTFKRKVDNTNGTLWQPTLRHKYNAKVPLGYNLQKSDGVEAEGPSNSLHPYHYEIKHISYPSRMFTSTPPVSPRSFDDTPFSWVSTPPEFATMLDKLRGAGEIAVDLEYHSHRTFGGFVCLMQISTREEDFVVDTLSLRDEMEELNEVFTDPNVVKVFHGAQSDIVWLQQDFNLYIVNLFDTYHASKILDFPRHGLATLLEMYCDFTADKRYQLADWRIRPLPAEMLQYARSDTHFLLFVYDNLRNALLDRAQSRAQSPSSSNNTPTPESVLPPAHTLVREVLTRSEETALRVYEKEVYDSEGGSGPGGWDTLARKWNKAALMSTSSEREGAVANVQREVYRTVHAWRDRVAREEDESTRYVLPNHYLFTLAERTPADMAGLLSVFRPVPPVVQRRAKELLDAIREAVQRALGMGGSAEAYPTGPKPETDVAISTAKPEAAAQVPSAATPLDSQASTLWSSATSSRLFGSTLWGKHQSDYPIAPSLVASRSTLFGTRPQNSRSRAVASRRSFAETAARIHRTLVIAPTVPRAAEAKIKEENALENTGEDVLKTDDGVEIPFVPASARGIKPEPVDDTIVVVGQAKRRKRKRAGEKGGTTDAGSGTGAVEEAGEEGEMEVFDYGSVSNILDDGSDHEREEVGGGRKKRKQGKGTATSFYGNFPAPPKAHSEVKRGNQSRTFR
ncbi:ribonuclease H-like domain-containing protein [Trametes meyenii]|nr:ribonuclease H-like domain-containing protein [Trametes meyenii]